MPVLAEQVLAVGVGLVDTWLTGNYLPGDKYLAAIGQMAYLLWLIPSLFSFVSIGATALVARFTGAGDRALANHCANQAFTLGGVFAAVITCWLALGGDQLVAWLQLPSDAAALAQTYLRYMVPVIPAMMAERIAIACLHGAGDTITGMITRVIVNLTNIVLSLGLVTGWGPMPELGWNGIALGTAISHVIGATILLVVLIRGRAGLVLKLRELRFDSAVALRLLRVGVPGGLDVLMILFCHLWFVALINSLGNEQAAAHSLGIRIESLAYLPGTAFQVAATTLAGQYLGARDARRAGRSVLDAMVMGGGVMIGAGVVFFTMGHDLATFFTGGTNPQTAEQAAQLLRIASFAMPALAISMIISGALRGAGDTRWPLAINVIGMLGIRIPGTYLMIGPLVGWTTKLSAHPDHGALLAAWYCMVIDISLRAILVLVRFFHGGWKSTKV